MDWITKVLLMLPLTGIMVGVWLVLVMVVDDLFCGGLISRQIRKIINSWFDKGCPNDSSHGMMSLLTNQPEQTK